MFPPKKAPAADPIPDIDDAIAAGPAPGRPLRVVSVDDSGDGRVVVNLEGDDGAVAQLPMDAAEAAEYTEGTEVMLSCSPCAATPPEEEEVAEEPVDFAPKNNRHERRERMVSSMQKIQKGGMV